MIFKLLRMIACGTAFYILLAAICVGLLLTAGCAVHESTLTPKERLDKIDAIHERINYYA